MRKLLLFLVLGLFSSISIAANPSFPGGPGQYGVGLRVVQLLDKSRVYRDKIDLVTGKAVQGERARPIQALIWYPADKQNGATTRYIDYLRTAATEEGFERDAVGIDQFVGTYVQDNYPHLDARQSKAAVEQPMLARRDSRPVSGAFPIVIYAPGSSMSAHENADLCEYLASYGYIVVASASFGPHTRSINLDLESAESEARDISFLLGYAATLPQADARHVAAMGYSFGGLANVLAAARDDRISALVSLDGSVRYFPSVVKQASSYATPERLALPMLYLGGKPSNAEAMSRAKDVATSYSLMNQMKYSDLYNVTMYTMEHAAFQSESLRLGPEARFGEYAREEARLAHGWMGRYVRAFLDAYLRGDAAGLAFMTSTPAANAVPRHLLAVDVHRSEGEPATLATMAAQYARHGHKDLEKIYRDMNRRDANFKPDERALIAWGEKFLDLKRYTEATEIYGLTTSLYPDSGRAVFYLAMTYDRNHDNAAALKAYQRVLGFWPDQVEAKQAVARLEAETGR
jgi:dienelactone hydrolase